MPAVSVIVPTYDRLPFLRMAVASVLAQTAGDLELIVVDDGSTDGTGEYLESIADPRLRAIRTARLGTAARARNAGIAESQGAWIAFLDSDDAWAPTKLERQQAALRATPGARWSSTSITLVDFEGTPVARPEGAIAPARPGWIFEDLLFDRATAAIQGVMAEAALVREVGGFDEALATFREDQDFVLKLAERSAVAAVDEPLVRVREHSGRSAHQERDLPALVRDYFERLIARSEDPARRRSCTRRYAIALADLASGEARRGRVGNALRMLLAAWSTSPVSPEVWRATLRVAAYGARRVRT